MNKPKYSLGDTVWWVYSDSRYGKRIPCPMCFGKRRVTLVLGDGSSMECQCEGCKRGIDEPDGTMTAWEPVALIKSGAVTGVFRDVGGWRYEAGHERLNESEVFGSEAEAAVPREVALAEVTERAALWYKDNFRNTTQKQLWSAGYHRSQIKDYERQIEWHRMRLCMVKEKKTDHGGSG